MTDPLAVLQEFARHGLNADLTPTIDCTNAATCYDGFRRYLARLDQSVRDRAAAALEQPCPRCHILGCWLYCVDNT
jgi:hypothetical protein